ncbi:unnamed protein product [Didymodactylos carnosus]|uniref:Speckle-type POZ protein n=1 Tax=Didymodactylos carnosus TaxID=1234261 RepID=A0A813PSC0_9BILA|nr:unnamed protein product [Didymodactylos carnosus]CAF0754684.1 unnamed protein product [Didymodactylos carnosus]CAF3496737.1 unnamed protein product [Didymodactylos carnosus]CAF3534895.1 unnamed protein product [Didymodactylos carnosus]
MYNPTKSASTLSLASNESCFSNDYSLDSVCCTKRTLHTFSHMWIIENFSTYLEDPEPIICLSSSLFSPVSGLSVATQWRLVCYPKGNYGASSNYMSIFLEYVKGEKDVKAKAEYALVNRKCELTEIRKDAQFSVYKSGNTRGFINYIKYDTLTLLENDTLNDDKLKIYVRIIIMDDHITEETKYQEFDECNGINFTTKGLEGLVRDFSQLLSNTSDLSDVKITVKQSLHQPSLNDSLSSDNMNIEQTADYSNRFNTRIVQYNAHKLILACRSPVLAAMFTGKTLENNTNTIEINDLKPETIKSMLEYIYTGKVNDIKNSTVELYRCADKYQLEDLRLQAEMALMNSISIDSSAEILLLADQHHSKELKLKVIQFIVQNLKAVTSTEGWHKYVSCVPDLVTEVIQATAQE